MLEKELEEQTARAERAEEELAYTAGLEAAAQYNLKQRTAELRQCEDELWQRTSELQQCKVKLRQLEHRLAECLLRNAQLQLKEAAAPEARHTAELESKQGKCD
ncbi:hypothetical protein ABPG77_010308 [Micractinium sp. CCAP 211/92]